MAITSKDYAKSLLGDLDLGYTDTARKLSKDIYETDWETLKNKFTELKANLDRKRAEADTSFAKSAEDVQSASYDRLNNANTVLARKGLLNSGVADIAGNMEVAQKGEDINTALGELGNTLVNVGETQKQGSGQFSSNAEDIGSRLSSSLGNIGAEELAAKTNYNNTSAGLAMSKDARDMNNALEAARRRITAASAGSGTSKEEQELEDFAKKQTINAILSGINPETGEALNWNDSDKAAFLKIMIGVENPNSAIAGYTKNLTAEDTYNKSLKVNKEELKKANNVVKRAQNTLDMLREDQAKYNNKQKTTTGNARVDAFNNVGGFGDSNDLSLMGRFVASGDTKAGIDQAVKNAEDYLKKAKQAANITKRLYDKVNNEGTTYQDLAKMLYGK